MARSSATSTRSQSGATNPSDGRRVRGTWGVYVIQLDDDPLWVYVGQSYHSPEDRFKQHRNGIRSSRIVRRRGRKLRPELYRHRPRYTSREQALRAEADLAAELRRRGFRVEGGH
jgi:predicted GIY-YIG superfamily endonuclease